MRTHLTFGIIATILLAVLAPGTEGHETESALETGQNLVQFNADCATLSDAQLEAVGEYLMQVMHPTDHEEMHAYLGFGNNTEAEERFHVNLAKATYCGNPTPASLLSRWQEQRAPTAQPAPTNTTVKVLTILLVTALALAGYFWNKTRQPGTPRP